MKTREDVAKDILHSIEDVSMVLDEMAAVLHRGERPHGFDEAKTYLDTAHELQQDWTDAEVLLDTGEAENFAEAFEMVRRA